LDVMPLFPIVFQSIPEAIVLIYSSLSLLGFETRGNLKKIILLGILNSLYLVLVRSYLPFGYHTLLGLAFLTLSLNLGLKIDIIKSFVVASFGIILLGILESIFIPLIGLLLDQSIEGILENQYLRTFVGYPHLLVLATIGFLAEKKEWYLVNLALTIIPKKLLAVIIVILLQVFFITFFNITALFDQAGLILYVFKNHPLLINLFFIIGTVADVAFIGKIFHMAEAETLMAAEDAYIKNVDDLFNSFRQQRHDFNNHLQTLYTMIYNSGNEKAKEYLDFILDDFDQLNELVRLKHSALAALLKAKLAVANSKNIAFDINCQATLENIKIKPHELVSILGNLIDNAIEAVEDLEQGKKISLEVSRFNSFILFRVTNPGTIPDKENPEKIFEENFTTKNRSKHQGMGLSTVKKLVSKNKGEIAVKSTENSGTEIRVILPV